MVTDVRWLGSVSDICWLCHNKIPYAPTPESRGAEYAVLCKTCSALLFLYGEAENVVMTEMEGVRLIHATVGAQKDLFMMMCINRGRVGMKNLSSAMSTFARVVDIGDTARAMDGEAARGMETVGDAVMQDTPGPIDDADTQETQPLEADEVKEDELQTTL